MWTKIADNSIKTRETKREVYKKEEAMRKLIRNTKKVSCKELREEGMALAAAKTKEK